MVIEVMTNEDKNNSTSFNIKNLRLIDNTIN